MSEPGFIRIKEEISVEIKAIINPGEVHLAQALNYPEAYNLETGLLINFRAKSLQFKKVFNKSRQSTNLKNPDSENKKVK